jgi:hypothetical protein
VILARTLRDFAVIPPQLTQALQKSISSTLEGGAINFTNNQW